MNQVRVRRHRCERSVDSKGNDCVGPIDRLNQETIDVRLAASVRVNALAAMARGNLRYPVLQHELRLLLSYIDGPRNRSLRLRRREFAASASHIRRFVSESFGLAMLTAVTEWAFGWRARRRAIAHFDALPSDLVNDFTKSRVRPDLLFQLPAGRLAGEARGRSQRAPRQVTEDQRRRLNDLLRWSAAQEDHPFVMTWASITERGALIDLFQMDDRRPSPSKLLRGRGDEFERNVDARIGNLFGALYQDAPEGPANQQLFDRRVRGSWTLLDLAGPADTQLFIGVMQAPITPEEEEVRAARVVDRPRDEPVEADLTGGLVIALIEAGTPPPWREVERTFE